MQVTARGRPGLALTLDSSVRLLPRVGDADAKRLARLGIVTVRDLLLHLPDGWEPFGEVKPVGQLSPAQKARVEGVLVSIAARTSPFQRRKLTEGRLQDDTGGYLKLVWFNQPYLAKQLKKGDRLVVAGAVRHSRYSAELEMHNPSHELLRPGDGTGPALVTELMPKYRLTDGLSSRKIARWVEPLLSLAGEFPEVLPEPVRRRHHLLPMADAIRLGHRPRSEEEWVAARARLAWQELFELQLAFLQLRQRLGQEPATPVPYRQEVGDRFKAGLPFELTGAQRQAARAVFRDLEKPTPMNRLLNGDVGSGKTAVAAAAVAMAHAAGLQAIVMAPTEILARQHLGKFRSYLESTFPDLRVDLLVSGLSAPERRRVRTAAASGQTALVVGTHALIEEGVEFAQLGLAVVDEQHRFGTAQREALRNKGSARPHFLAMTATPIPRTLALARYGEMALSILDELPPGRTPVATTVVEAGDRQRAYDVVRAEVQAGRQAFVICPLIEESETVEARAATAEFERLATEVFPDLRLALVHGRLRDKDQVMAEFAAGRTDVLVATAVVEVGVDVPNATVMLIEGAERFGLAQLHQFRGRVGRGTHQSHCLLLGDDSSEKVTQRLRLLETIHDGFRLAEEDMRLRGAGELLGSRQHGLTDQAMQALLTPMLLDEVRLEAEKVLASDPALEAHPLLSQSVARRLEAASLA